MQLFSWLHKRVTAQNHTRCVSARKPASRFRPHLEGLEDRDVPSTLTVTNNLDSGPGSLRAEIAAAENKDTIVFAPSLDGQTITLVTGELDINKSLTIQGPGAGQLTVSGGGLSRVFAVDPRVKATLSGMAIRDGNGVFTSIGGIIHPLDGSGGAILNQGSLTVTGCGVMLSSAESGGGIFNTGSLTVSGCIVSNNSAEAGDGGGIYNAGTAIVSSCTVFGNNAGYGEGGGIYNAGKHAGTLTVVNSDFYLNLPDNIYGPFTDGGSNTFN